METLKAVTINGSMKSASPVVDANGHDSPDFNRPLKQLAFNNKEILKVQAVDPMDEESQEQLHMISEDGVLHNNAANYSILDHIVNGRYQITQLQPHGTASSNLDNDSGLKDMME